MSTAAGGWGRSVLTRSQGPRAKTAWRVALTLSAIVGAYHYSLSSVIRTVGLDSPLAYLGLVPFVALGMAAVRGLAPRAELHIHDRQLDYIVGLPLLLSALAIMYTFPDRLSTSFWIWRIDLLSLPLFVAGAVALVFGVRALWRIRSAILFLLLAWPVPYVAALDRGLALTTNTTTAAVRWALGILPVAEPVAGSDGSLFAVSHGPQRFLVSVVSACSGVNGMVGFVLLGAAFVSLVRGNPLAKLVWLLGGMAFLWSLNVGRVLMVFAVGRRWGEAAAIDGFHPYIGLVTFNLGLLAMVLVMPLIGLRFRWARHTGGTDAKVPVDGDRPPPSGTAVVTPPRAAVTNARAAISVIVVTGALLGVANSGLSQYGLVASALGSPRLVGFSQAQGRPEGWSVAQTDAYTWGVRFFGPDSTWKRFTYPPGLGPTIRSSAPVIADVVSTSKLSTLSDYGLEACYDFHGYKTKDARSVDIGAGITGRAVSFYESPAKSDWTTLYWQWPVRTPSGTRYERVVLMMSDSSDAELVSPPTSPDLSRRVGLSIDNAARGRERSVDTRLAKTRDFLVSFAQAVVKDQAAQMPPPDPTSTLGG